MQLMLILLVCLVNLPMASFAYAEEWDDFFRDAQPRSLYDLGAKKAGKTEQVSASRLQQVKRLDQEILILRAEMSKKNGDVEQVERYLTQLNKQYVLPEFKARVARLQGYVESVPKKNTSIYSLFSHAKNIDFPMHNPNAVVAIVLPVSGVYGQVGADIQSAIQTGLTQAGFAGKLIAIDSAIYDSAFEIWEVLKYYEPNFIFGPLEKSKIAQWQALKTGVATLYFNDTTTFTHYEFSLSPSKLAGLEQVFQTLNQGAYQRILVLKNKSESSQMLEQAFNQAWLNLNSAQDYITSEIDRTVGQSIDEGLNVLLSNQRKNTIQNLLQEPLEFTARTRQDIEAVVSFVPQSEAIQIAPYLNFLPTQGVITHIWYPSKTPSSAYLMSHLDAWQQTFAILPANLMVNSQKNNSQSQLNFKNGLFYALGQVAIEIVKNPSLSSTVDSLVETDYGVYLRNANGQFHLLPDVYWADNGVFEKFVLQPE
ncbi:MAG: penicillin-binding protein activator [Thiomicrorhabdus sp.]|nr:penicillin-binding protein activator [Thiomicrorhabdus sp.]